jgi:acyl phosphate:glycerol-3-phosphate acyltransferase
MIIAKFILVIVLGYLLGSIPFGVIVSRLKGGMDIMKSGSGKMGATNVLRTAGAKAAVMVLVGDLVKGVLAVVFAGIIFGNDFLIVHNFGLGALVAQVLAALASVAGHNWSIFLKFKGGRGVATFFGGLMALCPPAAIVGGEVLIVSAGFTKYMSFGSILGTVMVYVILAVLTVFYKFPIEYLIYSLVGGLVIIIMHRDNINRLVAGTERKIGQKAESHGSSPAPLQKP